MLRRPTPAALAPGQESVWSFPRPPALRPSTEHITVVLGGVTICETHASLQVLETSHPPTYYLPRSSFVAGSLRAADGHSFCEWKGVASYLDVLGATEVAARAAWFYPSPSATFAELKDHIALYPGAMDGCFVDGERVTPQPGGFYGGWVTSKVAGPFKGIPGSNGW